MKKLLLASILVLAACGKSPDGDTPNPDLLCAVTYLNVDVKWYADSESAKAAEIREVELMLKLVPRT